MLAQAALKEAESARLMNFIILPFTIVTVIFVSSFDPSQDTNVTSNFDTYLRLLCHS